MTKARNTLRKYDISSNKFQELYYFCMQYQEWKEELRTAINTVKSIQITDLPTTHNHGDATGQLAMRRMELERKCKLVEQTAMETDADLYQYILKAVTEGAPYHYLQTVYNIPCSRGTFYSRRRKFYWLLSQKK